jgi:peroxiredoxin
MMKKVLVWIALMVLPVAMPLSVSAAPDVPLKDFKGKDRNANQIIGKGKWTVVVVWAHDCHVCNEEIHQMGFFHDAHKNKDAIVLGITVDGWKRHKLAQGFLDKHTLNFENLIAEPDQAIMMKFGAGPFIGTPTYYVYEPNGKLVAQNIGPVAQEDIENFMASYKPEGPDGTTDPGGKTGKNQ